MVISFRFSLRRDAKCHSPTASAQHDVRYARCVLSANVEQRLERRVGQTINGKYRLDALIGAGGMGAVYAATHRNGARAALKILHPELSANIEIRRRFQREAYVANQLGHPAIVRVIDDDIDEDGCAYLVMDLLVGETLEARRCALGGRLPLDVVVSITLRIVDVLAAAHAQGIVHRDIKPENVFLTADGGLKLMDFGIARALDGSGGTRTGDLMGTPGFMPPEQAGARNSEIDGRTDVWAVGALMFVLLTGEEVHPARTSQQQLIFAATKPARSVKTRLPLPDSIAHVIDTALAFHREGRWQTANAMRNALSQLLPIREIYAVAPVTGPQDTTNMALASTLAGASVPPLTSATLVMGSVRSHALVDTADDPSRKM